MSYCKGKSKRRQPQGKGRDHVMKGIKGHTWETPKKIINGYLVIKGIRRCKDCGYTPETQREELKE